MAIVSGRASNVPIQVNHSRSLAFSPIPNKLCMRPKSGYTLHDNLDLIHH